jgi:hypothetical protein
MRLIGRYEIVALGYEAAPAQAKVASPPRNAIIGKLVVIDHILLPLIINFYLTAHPDLLAVVFPNAHILSSKE